MKINSLIDTWDFEIENFEFDFLITPNYERQNLNENFSFLYYFNEQLNDFFSSFESNFKIINESNVIFEFEKNTININDIKKLESYKNLQIKISINFINCSKKEVLKKILEEYFHCLFLAYDNEKNIYSLINGEYQKYPLEENSISHVFSKITQKNNVPNFNQELYPFLREKLELKIKKTIDDWLNYE